MKLNIFKKKQMLLLICSVIVMASIVGGLHAFADNNSDIKLEYKFTNTTKGSAAGTIELTTSSSNTGAYSIYWANDNGKLEDYSEITTIESSGTDTKSYTVASLNAIPENANKIVAVKDDAIKAEYKIDSNKLISCSKKFSFGALSDVHLEGGSNDEAKSKSDFDNELNYFKSQNVAFLGTSGDITRDGKSEDIDAVVSKIKSFGLPVYTARGNHDTRNACGSNWEKIEPNGTCFEKVVNDEVFVFMGLNKEDYTNPFTSEQISQLKSILEKYKNKRVFMFEHIFVGDVGNVNGLYPYDKLSNDGTAGEFKTLMKENKNVILFTGHSHLDYDLQKYSDYANVQESGGDYGYRVHCPSATRPRKNDDGKDSSKTYDYKEGALGYLVDVYDGYIVLTGRDFVANKNLPYATYVLVTDPSKLKSENNSCSEQTKQKNENNNSTQCVQESRNNTSYSTQVNTNNEKITTNSCQEKANTEINNSSTVQENKQKENTSSSTQNKTTSEQTANNNITENTLTQATPITGEQTTSEDSVTTECIASQINQDAVGSLFTNDVSKSGSSSELENSPTTDDSSDFVIIVIIGVISVLIALGFYFRRKNSY